MKLLPIITTIALLVCASKIQSQTDEERARAGMEPGKCYGKCASAFKYQEIEKNFPIYTGKRGSEVELDSIVLKYTGTDQAPVQIARLPEGWQAHESMYECIVFVRDTAQSTDFVWQIVRYRERTGPSGEIVWKEIVCPPVVNSSKAINAIFSALEREGYLPANEERSYNNPKFKLALTQYQQDNGLCWGSLSVETIGAMGIKL